jgi:hypothetical protein
MLGSFLETARNMGVNHVSPVGKAATQHANNQTMYKLHNSD